MYNTDYEEKYVTKTPIETAKISPSAVVPVVATIEPVDIKEPPFQTVTANFYASNSTSRTTPTYSVPFSAGVPVVMTRAKLDN